MTFIKQTDSAKLLPLRQREMEMGSEAEEELLSKTSIPTPTSTTPATKLLQISTEVPYSSPTRSGMRTPPFHTAAAVPFRWEEEPGKPWPCTALVIVPKQPEDFSLKSLELPPRLLNEVITANGAPLLKGPRLQGSSFRIGGKCYGPFWEESMSGGKMDALGSGSSSYVFPSVDRKCDWDCSFKLQEKGRGRRRIRRTGSFPLLTHTTSHFWRSMYEGLKGAIPWRTKGIKKIGS